MSRYVTFCIKIGVALLVLAVISNTSYAAITTETVDGNSTMTIGSISGGTYTDTQSDNGATQDLLEEGSGNAYSLDCYYNLTATVNESRISAFEIGVNAWYTIQSQTDSFTVYVWNNTVGSWDSTNITVNSEDIEVHYNDTSTMGIEHIRDSDGNISIRFDDNVAGKQATLHIDYLYVNLTYTTISGVATDKLTYKVGETITTTWTTADGFGSGESRINVEYWDYTDGTQFNLTSHEPSETLSTSSPLTSNEAGHEIDVYVYTTSNATGGNSTAITQGYPWPQTSSNAVQSWKSYAEETHTTAWGTAEHPYDSTNHTAYMYGEGFTVDHEYKVAYYDVHGCKAQTELNNTSIGTALSSQYDFTTNASSDAGTWHSAVYDAANSPPSTYNATDTNNIIDKDFTVDATAIPEFPAVIAAIAVCMLCAVSYMVMRRNEYGKE